MRWRRSSDNADVIDQRSAGPVTLPRAGGGLGLVGVLVFLAIQLLGGGSSPALGPQTVPGAPQAEDGLRDFSVYVFHDTQDFWAGRIDNYQHAKLVLYRGGVDTGCGSASSAVGPFYCPQDQRVYLDLSFYSDMTGQLGAKGGDFAWAYVIAHEMGHHVQNLLGIDDQVRRQMDQNPDRQNELSVRQELQADCFAGVWAHSTYERGMLEKGDLQEGLRAAAAVGDDRLQKQAGGRVNPETWTHGSSQQRQTWFDRGFTSGSPDDCDTFNGDI
jgi:predicted metalloprotease